MKKFVLMFMLALSMVNVVNADDSVQLSTKVDLTPAQKAELASQAAKMASDNAANPAGAVVAPKTVESIKEWVDIGTAIGSGLAASAKQLGVAANDFAQTPVGRFTVFMIAWHFVGHTLLHVFFALLWLTVVTSIFVWMYRRAAMTKTVTYYNKGEGPKGVRKVTKLEPHEISENLGASMLVSVAVAVIIFVVMLIGL